MTKNDLLPILKLSSVIFVRLIELLAKFAVILSCGYWTWRSIRDHDLLQATLFAALLLIISKAHIREFGRPL